MVGSQDDRGSPSQRKERTGLPRVPGGTLSERPDDQSDRKHRLYNPAADMADERQRVDEGSLPRMFKLA